MVKVSSRSAQHDDSTWGMSVIISTERNDSEIYQQKALTLCGVDSLEVHIKCRDANAKQLKP